MEKELGYKLINRSNQGITLTEKGETVKETSIEILNLWRQMQNKIALPALDNNTSQILKLCVSPRISESVLPKYINQLQKLHPNIQVYSEEEPYLDILNGKIDTDAYDIIFNTLYYRNHNYLDYYNETVYTDFVPLFEHKTYLICNKESAFANYKSLTLSNLKHLPIRTYASKETSESSYQTTTDLYKKLGLNETIMISNSITYCLQGLLDNLFYFFCAQGPITKLFDRPELVSIPVQLPFKIYTGYHRVHNKPFTPAAQHFIHLISEEVTVNRLQ